MIRNDFDHDMIDDVPPNQRVSLLEAEFNPSAAPKQRTYNFFHARIGARAAVQRLAGDKTGRLRSEKTQSRRSSKR